MSVKKTGNIVFVVRRDSPIKSCFPFSFSVSVDRERESGSRESPAGVVDVVSDPPPVNHPVFLFDGATAERLLVSVRALGSSSLNERKKYKSEG